VQLKNRERSPHGSIANRGEAALTVGQVLAFYCICVFSIAALWKILGAIGLSQLTGLFSAPLITSFVYFFDPRIFSRTYWHFQFPASEWIGVVTLALFQVLAMTLSDLPLPPKYPALFAIFLAPVVEELARAVMISPLASRLGVFWSVTITSILWAVAHDLFWLALVQQLALSIIFVRTRKSLPAAITAHFVMNVIAVVYPFAHASLHHRYA
jgi:membrane protease YdiL (CAAX protease family)